MNPADHIQTINKVISPNNSATHFPVEVKTWHDLQDYQQSYDAMKQFNTWRTAPENAEQRFRIADQFWLLSHPDVYTLGQAGLESHLLRATGIPLLRVDRGGQITYHGPGQMMLYCLIDLKRLGLYVRDFVFKMESAIITALAKHGVLGVRKEGAPGIYVQNNHQQLAKIAALGLKISNGCSYHGLALNIDTRLEYFDHINPCGYEGLQTTDLLTCLGLKNEGGGEEIQNIKKQSSEGLIAALMEELYFI